MAKKQSDTPTSDAQVVIDALSSRQVTFSGPSAYAEATLLRDQQRNRWVELLGRPPRENSSQNMYSFLRDRVGADQFGLMDKKDGTFSVASPFPILTDDGLKLLQEISERDVYLVAGAIAVELGQLFENYTNNINLQLVSGIGRYQNAGLNPQELGSAYSKSVGELSRAAESARSIAKQTREELEKAIESNKADVDAFKKSLGESSYLTSGNRMWSEKSGSHSSSYWFWFIIFIAALAGFIVLIVYYSQDIIKILPRDKDNNLAYAGLVIFLVPVIGFGWLLRIISRFINTQQVLRDDASHREAMLRTYLALVADPNAKLDEKDRVIILSAIFRPLPGTQMEDVSPPSILDLIKK